jgi:hypothetical protein
MKRASRAALAAVAAMLVQTATAQPLEPDIVVTRLISAPVADVWKAWTTADGIARAWPSVMANLEKRFAKP